MTRGDLIAEVQALAQRLGVRSVSRATFKRETGISEWHVGKHFDSPEHVRQLLSLMPA